MNLVEAALTHGGQLHRLSDHFRIPASELLDFSANINPDGPPASVLAALRASLDDPAMLTQYPDLEQTQLKLSIAAYAGVPPQHIAVANGFVPLLDAALRTLRLTRCLLPVPAFTEYRRALERAHVPVTPYLLSSQEDFRYDPQHLLDSFSAGRHDAILLANPQNPSGVLCPRGNLLALIQAACEQDIRVLVDEAFIDYAPAHSLTADIAKFPNLIVFRSVTKFHGIPGMRVAYAVGNAATIQSLNDHLPPWPITTFATVAARAALEDKTFAAQTLARNNQRRDRLVEGMRALGLHTYPASANFLLLRLPSFLNDQSIWHRAICEHRIVLRNCANFEGLALAHLRCAIRSDEDNLRLIAAFHSLITPNC